MLLTPRSRRSSSVGAATETGVLKIVSSRFMAVTVTSSVSLDSQSWKSTVSVAPAATR